MNHTSLIHISATFNPMTPYRTQIIIYSNPHHMYNLQQQRYTQRPTSQSKIISPSLPLNIHHNGLYREQTLQVSMGSTLYDAGHSNHWMTVTYSNSQRWQISAHRSRLYEQFSCQTFIGTACLMVMSALSAQSFENKTV